MDKSSEKKPIIPEMNIPDVADYQPSDSALAKIATRTYVFTRTRPRILTGSIAALALTAAAVAFISAPTGPTTLPPLIEHQANDATSEKQEFVALNDAPKPTLEQSSPSLSIPSPPVTEIDDTIERVDTEELRTSVKPLDFPDEPSSNDTDVAKPVADEASVSTPVAAPEPVVDQDNQTGASTPVSSKISEVDFSKRFGENLPTMTEGEAQQALKDGLARVGSLEQSIGNLKNFPFDLVVKPEPEAPKVALLKIVQGAEATSGFWREIEEPSEKSEKGKKQPKQMREEHFLVLQAVDEATDKPIEVDVKDMDSGKTEKHSSWAVLIPEKQFLDFAQSKQEDGSFSQPVLGKLNLETGEIEWEIDTDGRALINWKEFAE